LPKGDLPMPEEGRARLFYPRYFRDVEPKFQEFEELTLSIPFSTAYPTSKTWDLAEAYRSGSPGLISCLLRFLRDRAIELILWSTYQMEIRSIGLIPVQYLYQINLSDDVQKFFKKMIDLHGESPDPKKREEITNEVSRALLKSNFNSQIKLTKAYGGPHRDIFCPEIFEKEREENKESKNIKWLKK
jgi:hypothetical protein